MFFGFFGEKDKCYNVFGNITSYSIVQQMILYKQIFGWLTSSSSTREEKSKSSHTFKEFSWLAQDDSESLTKIITYLNYCRMLCACSVEHIALFQVDTSLRN